MNVNCEDPGERPTLNDCFDIVCVKRGMEEMSFYYVDDPRVATFRGRCSCF